VNILLDNPMTQFSFGWILSLNWLCQKWGQVHLFVVDNALRRTEAADGWINDVVCTCPEMAMSALYAESGRRAYVYQFLRSIPGKGQNTLGSFHSLELPYVFGAFRQPAWNWLPFEQIDLSLAG
jgi:carboxylesterase type B